MSEIRGQLSSVAVSVGTTAVLLCSPNGSRNKVIVQNAHASQNLYVGPSGVATTTGIQIVPGASVGFDDFNGPLYGIASGAATDTRVLEIY
jgi:hypothetical protein